MRAHRLQRLTLLTQGVALLGIGSETACHDQPPDTVHINAPMVVYDAGGPTPAPQPTPSAPASADAGNAPLPVASGSAPTAAPSENPPPFVPHMNAVAPPPKTVNAPPKR